jgi:Tol biopolymer transport system component
LSKGRTGQMIAVGTALVAAAAGVGGCGGGASAEQDSPVPGGIPLPRMIGERAAWSPDGRRIAVPTPRGLLLIRARDGAHTRVHAPRAIDGRRLGLPIESTLAWSSDSERIYFLSAKGPMQSPGYWANSIHADGSNLRQTPLGVPVGSAAWSPGGWPLLFVPNARTISAKGRVGPVPDIWLLESPRSTSRRIARQPGAEFDLTISPNGRTVLYTNQRRLWRMELDGSNRRPLTPKLASLFSPSWSPDGRHVTLRAVIRGERPTHAYVLAATGGQLLDVSENDMVVSDPPAWTADGRWVTFSNYAGQIKRVHPHGGKSRTIARLPGEEVHTLLWSPDNRHLAYTADPIPPID